MTQTEIPTSRLPLPPENVFGHRKKLDFLRENIRLRVESKPGSEVKVLDVGCSNGQYVSIHLGDLGAHVHSIDIHQPSIEYAKENNPYPETINFEVRDLADLDPANPYEIAVLADIVEHMDHPVDFLKLIRERLTDDGSTLVSIPNGYGPFEIENWCDRKGLLTQSYWFFNVLSGLKGKLTGRRDWGEGPDEIPYHGECGHVQWFTIGSFRKVVEDSGFYIDEFRKGTWLGALCTSTWWGRYDWFNRINSNLGNVMPSWAVSTWYFRLKKKF